MAAGLAAVAFAVSWLATRLPGHPPAGGDDDAAGGDIETPASVP